MAGAKVVVVLAMAVLRARGCAPAPGCTCAAAGDSYYCTRLDLDLNQERYLEVDCKGNDFNCSALPQIKQSTISMLERIQITSCPLAPELSLACVLRAVGASGTNTLKIQSGASGLSELNLEGLEVEELNIMYDGDFHPTSVPAACLSPLSRVRRMRFVNGENVSLFANMFANASQHLEYLEIGNSGVKEIPDDAFFGLGRLVALNLWGNDIAYVSENAFRGLSSLKKLVLNSNPLGSLGRVWFARAPRLRALSLERTRLREIRPGALQGLAELRKINVQSDVVLTLEATAFSNLPNLTSLYLPDSKIPALPSKLFLNTTNLVNLTLSNNNIPAIPEDVFADLRKLQNLDLSRNQIEIVSKDMFNHLVSLETINLDGNKIQMLPENLFGALGALRSVRLSHNGIRHVTPRALAGAAAASLERLDLSHNRLESALPARHSPMRALCNLQTLNLSHNNISGMALDWRYELPLCRLTRLDLSHNAFTRLTESDVNILGKPLGDTLEVDFQYNQIAEVLQSQQFRTKTRPRNVRILLNHNPFNCTCVLFNFITDVQNKSSYTYNVTEATCDSPPSLQNKSLVGIPFRDLTCPVKVSSVGDSCLFRPQDLRMECDFNQYIYNHTKIPDPNDFELNNMSLRLRTAPSEFNFPEFVRELNLSNLNITNIPNGYQIPATIESLDLTRNRISVVPDYLFRDNLTLYLAENPIVCDCWTTDAVAKMIRLKDRIGDYKKVTCVSGFALSGQDPPSLCYVQNAIAWGVSSAFVVLFISIAIALLYLYRIEIQVYLYSKRWCLYLLPCEMIDYNKKYQVFISTVHVNWKFVNSNILPKIEGKYSTVVQERDWTFGGNILSLIHHSIEESMRTFLVLTPEYLESEWAMEVFRTLHLQATKDKRLRAVVLLVDVKKKHLDKEIQQNLSLATVIEHGERLFWEKIYYAFPKNDLIDFKSEKASILNHFNVNKMAACNN